MVIRTVTPPPSAIAPARASLVYRFGAEDGDQANLLEGIGDFGFVHIV